MSLSNKSIFTISSPPEACLTGMIFAFGDLLDRPRCYDVEWSFIGCGKSTMRRLQVRTALSPDGCRRKVAAIGRIGRERG